MHYFYAFLASTACFSCSMAFSSTGRGQAALRRMKPDKLRPKDHLIQSEAGFADHELLNSSLSMPRPRQSSHHIPDRLHPAHWA